MHLSDGKAKKKTKNKKQNKKKQNKTNKQSKSMSGFIRTDPWICDSKLSNKLKTSQMPYMFSCQRCDTKATELCNISNFLGYCCDDNRLGLYCASFSTL